MNKEVSAFLDCARLLGTILVFFGHIQLNWVPQAGRFIVPIGNESLAVMFVVSGFVIGFVSDRRESSLKTYFVHRSARAYSLLIPCVIFGFFIDCLGKHFMPDYYLHGSWPPLSSDMREAVKALFSFTFLGEAWGINFFPGSMAPYWTFPYEWSYYLMFGCLWYLRGWSRVFWLAVIGAVAGPPLLALFPLWLLGAGTYWLSNRLKLSEGTGKIILLSGVLAACIGQSIVIFFHLDFGYGAQESPELWPFYLAAFLFSVTTLGFRFSNISIAPYTRWAQWAAGASGTLYLLHFPLGRLFNGLIPQDWHPIERWLLLVFPVFAISLVFAEFNEKRREVWRRHIEAGLNYAQSFLQKRKLVPAASPD